MNTTTPSKTIKAASNASPAPTATPTASAAPSSPLLCSFLLSRVSASSSLSLLGGSGAAAHYKETNIMINNADMNQQHLITGQPVIVYIAQQPALHILAHVFPSSSLAGGHARINKHAIEAMKQEETSNYQAFQEGVNICIKPVPQPVPFAIRVLVRRLSPCSISSVPSPFTASIDSFVVHALRGRCVIKGAEWKIKLFGESHHVRVDEVQGECADAADGLPQVFATNDKTIVNIEDTKTEEEKNNTKTPTETEPTSAASDSAAFPPLDFSSIGGLDHELSLIREIIEYPIREAQFFKRYAIRPPHGVLLFGPPGCGKTMIARSIASSCGARFYSLSGPDVVSRFVGESEARVRSVFESARANAPSIIFIDEIDTLAPKREDAQEEMPKRLVATLLTLMDGLDQEAQAGVCVIGATNRPDALDSAMRRAGRFDREIEIGIPNEVKRLDILSKLLKEMPRAGLADEAVKEIAALTHGYVGADLKALCSEAAINALMRAQQEQKASMAASGSSPGRLPPPPPVSSLSLTHADLRAAMKQVRPSCMREILIDIPQTRWSDIGGQAAVKQRLQEAVEWPLKSPESFIQLGITPPKGILLYGPPGCSKTLMAKALACESSRNFLSVKGPELFNKYVGESEKAIRDLFRKARAAAPSIIFFDEIDSIAVARSSDGQDGDRVADRVLSQLLVELDGIEPLRQVTVLAATNRPDLIDRALMRPGRIDRILYVSPPDEESIRAIILLQLARMAHSTEVADRVNELAALCRGFSGAELANMAREAGMSCIKENFNAEQIEWRHFEAAARRVRPAITQEMLDFYEGYQKRSNMASC